MVHGGAIMVLGRPLRCAERFGVALRKEIFPSCIHVQLHVLLAMNRFLEPFRP